MNDLINETTDEIMKEHMVTNNTMNEDLKAQTKRKSKGITGRSSNKDIKLRRKICKEIVQKSPVITKSEFIHLYKVECSKADIKIPTHQTILKDARNCKITFDRKGNSKTLPKQTSFNRIGYDIGYYLMQIHVLCTSYDITVFNIEKDKLANLAKTLSLKKFLSRINELYATNSSNSNKINATALTTIIFIFNEKGLEKYIESNFEQEFRIKKNYLYTETSNYSFKIVFEFQYLKLMMHKIYEILEYTQPSYFLES